MLVPLTLPIRCNKNIVLNYSYLNLFYIVRSAASLSVTPARKVTSNCKVNLQINKVDPVITFVLTKSELGSKFIRCAFGVFLMWRG